MSRLKAAIVASALVAILAAPAASADGGVGVTTAVTAGLTTNGAVVAVAGGAHSGGGGSGGGPAGSSPIRCRYHLLADQPTAGATAVPVLGAEAASLDAGVSYWKVCTNSVTGVQVSRDLFVLASPDPAQVARDLAEEALARLVLPAPSLGSNPPNGLAVINVPVWLWVDSWDSHAESASAAGVTATVTARPTEVVWNTGDGRQERCAGPGTPYDTARPAASQRTDCSHTYTDRTGPLTITATVTWSVSYVATNGQSGDLGPVTRTATLAVDVRELVTSIGQG